jgi:hypothetical protein
VLFKIITKKCADYETTGFYQLQGRIPWTDIAEYPSRHMTKKSRPDSDYKLEEPSHMKSDGVDAWLKHWLKMQKKGSTPLVLKDGSDKSSESHVNKDPKIVDRRKGKKRYVEPDSDDEATEINDGVLDAARAKKKKGTDGPSLPKSPYSVGTISQSRRTFLASLSDDKHYKNLLLLLSATKVSNSLSESSSTNKWVGR